MSVVEMTLKPHAIKKELIPSFQQNVELNSKICG